MNVQTEQFDDAGTFSNTVAAFGLRLARSGFELPDAFALARIVYYAERRGLQDRDGPMYRESPDMRRKCFREWPFEPK